MNRSRTALLTGAGLLCALPVLAAAPAATAADPATRTITAGPITYSCSYNITTFDGTLATFDDLSTTITPTFDVPARLYPGQVVAPTPVKVVLIPQKELAEAARGFLGSRTAEGSSNDADLEITTAEGQSTQIPLGTLAAPREEIPGGGQEWRIGASGTSPAITVPATSRVRLSAPEAFSLQARLYNEDGTFSTAEVPCRLDDGIKHNSRTIAYLKVAKLYPRLTAKPVPTEVVANRTRPVVTVKGYSPATPTGAVQVREGTKVLGTATLKNGAAAVRLPVFGRKGTRTLTVAYAGDVSNNAATSTTNLTVR